MQQNEPWLTRAAASRLGEINIVFQPMSNEAPLLERGAFSTASLGQKERATLRGAHTPRHCPGHPRLLCLSKAEQSWIPLRHSPEGNPQQVLSREDA